MVQGPERSIEERLRNPHACYQLGKELPERDFEQYAERIIDGVATSAQWSLRAGVEWEQSRFERGGQRFFETIREESLANGNLAYRASCEWPDDRFDNYANDLVRILGGDNLVEAGLRWSQVRFKSYGLKLANQIELDPTLCLEAGVKWTDARFKAYASRFLGKIELHPALCLRAGARWSDERFEEYETVLVEKVCGDPRLAYLTTTNNPAVGWPWKRFKRNAARLIDAILQEPTSTYAVMLGTYANSGPRGDEEHVGFMEVMAPYDDRIIRVVNFEQSTRTLAAQLWTPENHLCQRMRKLEEVEQRKRDIRAPPSISFPNRKDKE